MTTFDSEHIDRVIDHLSTGIKPHGWEEPLSLNLDPVAVALIREWRASAAHELAHFAVTQALIHELADVTGKSREEILFDLRTQFRKGSTQL